MVIMARKKKQIAIPYTPIDEFDFYRVNQVIRNRRLNIANKNAIKSFIRKIIMIALVLWLLFTYIFGFQIVYNDDMFPKMVPSDLLLYYRLDRDFYVGDVVVVEKNDAKYPLRLVAKGGDTVDITPEGQYTVNGAYQAEQEIFYVTGAYDTEDVSYPLTLAEDEVFALGDMREGAKDSRYFGPVKEKEIKGKVFSLLRRSGF